MEHYDRLKVIDGMVGEGVGVERIRRITGYLTTTNRSNPAKLAEMNDRVKHFNKGDTENDI